MKYLLLLLPLFLFPLTIQAATPACGPQNPHPIDIWEEEFLRGKTATTEQKAVLAQVYQKWDQELNQVYKTLMAKLTKKEDQERLRQAQLAWIAFRDRESEFLTKSIYTQGSMAEVMGASARNRIVRQRVCDLYGVLEDSKDFGNP